jgi:deoxycytidylate deaminase
VLGYDTIAAGLREARRAALKSKHRNYYVGAAIFKNSRLISAGANTNKTHPKSTAYGQTLHAEMRAIINAYEIPKGSVLYVYRHRKNGTPGMAMPCSICMKMIEKTGIDTIIYTNPNGSPLTQEVSIGEIYV